MLIASQGINTYWAIRTYYILVHPPLRPEIAYHFLVTQVCHGSGAAIAQGRFACVQLSRLNSRYWINIGRDHVTTRLGIIE